MKRLSGNPTILDYILLNCTRNVSKCWLKSGEKSLQVILNIYLNNVALSSEET